MRSLPNERGVDLEVYDGYGSRYAVAICQDGVYWYEGDVLGSGDLPFSGFTPLATGLDNASTRRRETAKETGKPGNRETGKPGNQETRKRKKEGSGKPRHDHG